MSNTVVWVSVKDRMPETDRMVLVYSEGYEVFYSTWDGFTNLWSHWGVPRKYVNESHQVISNITHWAYEPKWEKP